MNRQRVKFSVTFPDYDRTEDVWVGIERAAKRAWDDSIGKDRRSIPKATIPKIPIRVIATDPDGCEWSGVVSLIPMLDEPRKCRSDDRRRWLRCAFVVKLEKAE